MSDWDNLVEPALGALEALLRKGDEMADRIEHLQAMALLDGDEIAEWRERLKQSEAREAALKLKLARAVDALDEAVYLLRPDEKDMMRQAGVYRIVTTLAILKEPSVK